MDLDDLISRYIDGELDSQAEAELHHRLSVSPEARAALRAHTALRDAARDTRALDAPSAEMHAALFTRLHREEGMAHAVVAAVVPGVALASPRPTRPEPEPAPAMQEAPPPAPALAADRPAAPSAGHSPARRTRRRRTALWFALPMMLLATLLVSELMLDSDERGRVIEHVAGDHRGTTVDRAPADAGSGATAPTPTENLAKNDGSGATSTTAPTVGNAAAPPASTTVNSAATAPGGAAAEPALAEATPVEHAPLYRSLPARRSANGPRRSDGGRADVRHSFSGALDDGYAEATSEEAGSVSVVNLMGGDRAIASSRRAEEYDFSAPPRVMSSAPEFLRDRERSPMADTTRVTSLSARNVAPEVSLNRNRISEGNALLGGLQSSSLQENVQSTMAQSTLSPPSAPLPVVQDGRYMSNQIVEQSVIDQQMQRSIRLPDSVLPKLVRKDTARRVVVQPQKSKALPKRRARNSRKRG